VAQVFALALEKEDQNLREKVKGLKRAADEDALPPQSQRESGERPFLCLDSRDSYFEFDLVVFVFLYLAFVYWNSTM